MVMIPDSEAATKAARVRKYERNTTCTDEWHAHWTKALIYTDGIKFVAETCAAYWLIDAVASHQPAVRAKIEKCNLRPFQVWRLRKVYVHLGVSVRSHNAGDSCWILDAWSDSPEYPGGDDGPASIELACQTIGYSDFPESLSPFEFWVEGETALLKAEH